jgi:hypothetical protein
MWRHSLASCFFFISACPALAGSAIFRCDRADNGDKLACLVRLVPYDDTKATIAARSDEPIEIPPGRYEIRAGSRGFALGSNVSYTSTEAVLESLPPHRVRLSLVPGGRVYVDPSAVPSPGAVQLLSFSTGKTDVLFVDREREIPVPTGQLVAVGLISPGKFLGITRILQIQRGQKNVVTGFDKPAAGRSNVLVRGDYVGDVSSDAKDVVIALSARAEKFESASATNAATGSHYSVFYAIPQGPKTIEVSSKRWRGTQLELTVSEPFVFKDDLTFVTRPSLTVRPVAGSGDRPERWKVKVYSCKESEFGPGSTVWPSLESCSSDRVIEASGSEAVVPYLNAKWYFVVMELGGQRAGKQVDLRNGQDRSETFEFKRRRVFGVVREADQGVAATLTFENYDTGERSGDVTSGPDGSYEAILWQSGIYRVEVHLQMANETEAAIYKLPVGDEESIRRDFTIPSGRVTVTVLNETTRDPIRGVSVGFVLAGAGEERKTDELGAAILPPLPPGRLRLIAQADGYQRKDETFEVLETKAMQRWNVLLKPLNDGHTFHAILPSGSPAASAIVLWSIDANGAFRFRQECDSAGLCRLAESPSDAELLYLVHPQAGLTVLPTGQALHDEEVRLRLRGGPLVVNVRRGDESQVTVLSAKILVEGVVIPPFALETIANLVGEPFRLYLYPGVQQPIMIAGLPAGTPVAVAVSSVGTVSNRSHESEPLALQLPIQRPVEISLP